jgi:hypothetical protein
MEGGNDSLLRVDQQDGQAVGHEYGKQEAGTVRYETTLDARTTITVNCRR